MNEAELVFTHLFSCDKATLWQKRSTHLNKKDSAWVASVLRRRSAGEPLQYILGQTEFMGFSFKVNANVLIPRPETEILVEEALKLCAGKVDILEIGTGSGCIAVSLAKFLPSARITALDISWKALEIARDNAFRHALAERIIFLHSDLFSHKALSVSEFDLIIANPPYVAGREIDSLQPEISFEPRQALDGGIDGLDFYRRIAKNAGAHLKAGGILMLEIGFAQAQAVERILESTKRLRVVKVIKDYNKIKRVVVAQKINHITKSHSL